MELYPLLESILFLYNSSSLPNSDRLIVTFHYAMLREGYRVLRGNNVRTNLHLKKYFNFFSLEHRIH